MVDAISLASRSDLPDISTPLRLDEDLKAGVRRHDELSIDCLFTLALEQDNPDREEAINFLLDLYFDNSETGAGLRAQLANDVLELCKLVSGMKGDLIAIPMKILAMAGFGTQSNSEQREKVLDHLRKNEPFRDKMVLTGQPLDSTLFDTNRYITSDELNAVAAKLNRPDSLAAFHHASSVQHEHDALITKFTKKSQQIDVVPLELNNHWVLWVMFTDSSGERSSLFFDSMAKLSETAKKELISLAKGCGMTDPVWVEKDLQRKAPNACGAFVMYAMLVIAACPDILQSALADFVEKFQKLDDEAQQLMILRARAELLDTFTDYHTPHETYC